VFWPFNGQPGFDFIIERKGEAPIKVNVKKASMSSGALGISTPCNKVKALAERILAIYPQRDIFIELPGDYFKGSKSRRKCIPMRLWKNQGK